jgi:ABC-type phosphate/phosphonate transport system substrate-binding protein
MGADWVASLPMYDFPELREPHDEFWGALAERLGAAGLKDVPRALTRGASLRAVWGNDRLLFGQGCEYPLAKGFGDPVRVVAHPVYSATGCEGARYRSAIIVRGEGNITGLRGRRCVVNELDSNSGMNLLRAAVAPLAQGGRFFGSVVVSGSHLRSVEMVASGEADIASIDCVSFAHFQRFYPALVSGVRVLSWTASSPSLPYIAAGAANDATVEALRAALADVFDDIGLAPVRERLSLRGVDLAPAAGFGEVLALERQAADAGYPVLR